MRQRHGAFARIDVGDRRIGKEREHRPRYAVDLAPGNSDADQGRDDAFGVRVDDVLHALLERVHIGVQDHIAVAHRGDAIDAVLKFG